ncbi:hypothetical protein [Geodermatophilus sp. DSM 44513]|uniref:hypothetical protein n=1 Tax=Geodermatophilus sp. DSM 44513 TaxID=1528104 RepID=UPI0012722F6E|nr:hypothetical protein [Geodermatophilus sp. DSM 44513]WNV73616.1 hypothetical protein RTG05_11530 [Geodermatophilus sp. DSM 44513]
MSAGSPPAATVRTALGLLRRHAGPAYLAALAATLVNTVPDVARQVLVLDDPRLGAALAVDAVGFATGLVAQLWVTGVVAALAAGGGASWSGALRRGTALAVRALRAAPAAVAVGVVLGGTVSALLTLPASVAALGPDGVLGPLGSPGAGAFTVATVSDVVASVVTLPFLASVLVVAGGDRFTARPGGQ